MLIPIYFNSQLTPTDKINQTCYHYHLQITDTVRLMILFLISSSEYVDYP